MFTHDRTEVLDGLVRLGGSVCAYNSSATWVEGRCDCKYGAEHPFSMGRESNGCPELRSIYGVIAAMSDIEWDAITDRAGMVNTRRLFAFPVQRGRCGACQNLAGVVCDLCGNGLSSGESGGETER